MNTWEAIEELARGALRGPRRRAKKLFRAATTGLTIKAKRRPRMRALKNENLQLEAVQETLSSVWVHRESYPGTTIARFYGWFFQVCDSRVIDIWRKESRHSSRTVELTREMEQVLPIREDCTLIPVDSHTRDALWTCMRELRATIPKLFDVIYLHILCEYVMDDVSEILDRPRSTVYRQKKKAKDFLGRCLLRKGITGAT